MRELVEAGYVKKESRFREGNRGQTSNLYTLFFPENTEEVKKEEKERYSEKCVLECVEQNNHKEQQVMCTKIVADWKTLPSTRKDIDTTSKAVCNI